MKGKKKSATISLRVPLETIEQLGQLAKITNRSRNYLAMQAIQDFIERESWQIQEIAEAIKEADIGDFATDEEVQALHDKWK